MIKTAIQDKYVILNNVAGSSLLGVVLEELPDSFIIGLPAKLVKKNDALSVIPYLPCETLRVFKFTLLHLLPLADEFELPYLDYVLERGGEIDLPEEEYDLIEARIEEIIASGENDVVELPSHIDFIFPEKEGMH